jgi:hypothetical protein
MARLCDGFVTQALDAWRALLPSPLAGEGQGERGESAETSASPPLPNPSPARGGGQSWSPLRAQRGARPLRQTPMTPPSSRVITMVAERGRPGRP